MNRNCLSTVLSLAACLSVPVGLAAQVSLKPQPPLDPVQQAIQEFADQVRSLWGHGQLSYDQKIDLGRLCERIEAAGEGGRPVPMAVIEECSRLMGEVVTSRQRQLARQGAQQSERNALRNLLTTFSVPWPEPLQAKWEQAFRQAWPDLEREMAERRAMQTEIAADVGRNPSPPRQTAGFDSEVRLRDTFYVPANLKLYMRQLEFTPYFGQRFDEEVLADSALSEDQRHELGTAILGKALSRRLGRFALTMVFRNMNLTPEQLAQTRRALEIATAELKQALADKAIEVSEVGELRRWLRRAFERQARLDTLLTDKQRRLLSVVEHLREVRPLMEFGPDEIEPELILEIDKLLRQFEAHIAEIPQADWGRNMVYQEAKLDRDSNIFRLAMKSQKLTLRRKGQIAKASLDVCFPELYRVFAQSWQRLLDRWPVLIAVDLPRNVSSPESLTPELWFHIYEIIARKEIWEALKDAQLTGVARLFAAQATDGKAMEMQILTQYKVNRSTYMLTEALFADPAFTPLQKLLIFETYWNGAGPFAGYYYALDLDADVLHARLAEMRKMLIYAGSRPPPTQLVFSVADIAKRQKASLESIQRWTEIGGLFSDQEMKILQARHDELLARLEEWGQYVPPDPYKAKEPPTSGANKHK